MRASWSDRLGVQTPLQSGNLASAAQSPACGGGLVSGSTAPAAAAVPPAATANPMATINPRIEWCILGPSHVGVLIVKPIHRPNAAIAIHRQSDSPPTT